MESGGLAQLRGLRESPARPGLIELLPHVGHEQILQVHVCEAIRKYKSCDTEITGLGHHARLLTTLCQATILDFTFYHALPAMIQELSHSLSTN